MNQLILNSEMKYPISLKMFLLFFIISPVIVALVGAIIYDRSIFFSIGFGFAFGLLFLWMFISTFYCPKQIIITDYYLDIQLTNGKVRRLDTKHINRLAETPFFSVLYVGKIPLFSKQFILTPKAGSTILEVLKGLNHKFKYIPLKK